MNRMRCCARAEYARFAPTLGGGGVDLTIEVPPRGLVAGV
jgi:hypothetical protein